MCECKWVGSCREKPFCRLQSQTWHFLVPQTLALHGLCIATKGRGPDATGQIPLPKTKKEALGYDLGMTGSLCPTRVASVKGSGELSFARNLTLPGELVLSLAVVASPLGQKQCLGVAYWLPWQRKGAIHTAREGLQKLQKLVLHPTVGKPTPTIMTTLPSSPARPRLWLAECQRATWKPRPAEGTLPTACPCAFGKL